MNTIEPRRGFGQPKPAFKAVLAGDVERLHAPLSDRPSIFRQYFQIAARWRWVIAGVVAACLALGLVITFLMTPRYTSTTTLEIQREGSRITNIQGVEQEASDADQEFYQTQYGLLKSRALAERVATRLRLVDDPEFFRLFDVDIEDRVGPGGRYTATGRAKRVEGAGAILLKNLRVTPTRASRLVDIAVTTPDASMSAAIANAWSANFIDLSLERRYEATSYARQFLEQRLQQLRQRLEQSERSLVAFAQQQRIINVPADGASGDRPIVAQDLATLNAELAKATAARVQAQARFDRGQDSAGALPEALANSAINALRQRRAELESDYAKLMVKFEPDFPAAQETRRQIDRLGRELAREEQRVSSSLSNEYATAREREQRLRERVDGLKQDLINLRGRSIQYNIYQREVDTNRALYEGLLQRYKEIGVAGGIGVNNVSIVDPAQVPNRPSSPRLLVNLILSLLAGLLIGGLAAYVLDQIDESIADPAEVEQRMGLPLLGTVPLLAEGAPRDALKDPKSDLTDAYMTVRTNLEFSTERGVPRTIAVTSTRPSEGKSTTALSLATLLSHSAGRVLLVDGDMRSPSVHELAGLDNSRGLSNFLAGKDDPADLIRFSEALGFSVMAAGPPPPNAAELLTGKRFQTLLDQLAESFDHIVVDSPPVLGLADAPLIAARVEAVVFALESNGIRTQVARTALDRLAVTHARLVGIVLTKFNPRRAGMASTYNYEYGYGRERA